MPIAQWSLLAVALQPTRLTFAVDCADGTCPAVPAGECQDTQGWGNGISGCVERGFLEEDGCSKVGWTCKRYSKNWCKNGKSVLGMEFALGARFNFPEKNCCECGKPASALEVALESTTALGSAAGAVGVPATSGAMPAKDTAVAAGAPATAVAVPATERKAAEVSLPTPPPDVPSPASEQHNDTCEDSPNWTNLIPTCRADGFSSEQGCMPEGWTCGAYASYWCKDGKARQGQGWTLGKYFNDPEKHCCVCGGGTRVKASPYVLAQTGACAGPEVWMQSMDLGVAGCYELAMSDSRCAKDYFTYVARGAAGQKNCGCKGLGTLTTRTSGCSVSDVYEVQAKIVQIAAARPAEAKPVQASAVEPLEVKAKQAPAAVIEDVSSPVASLCWSESSNSDTMQSCLLAYEIGYDKAHGCAEKYGQCYWTSVADAKAKCAAWAECETLYCTEKYNDGPYVCYARKGGGLVTSQGDTTYQKMPCSECTEKSRCTPVQISATAEVSTAGKATNVHEAVQVSAAVNAGPEERQHLQCEDTPGWTNGAAACVDQGHKEETGCTALGWTCKGYKSFWCKDGGAVRGFDWTLGSRFNEPEKHCCACGRAATLASK